ncbi:MAG: hypothetical protein K8T25_07300 [Planctomycetia bacterium]|nr:hypothetical protein [Planctomycetia bacterium]
MTPTLSEQQRAALDAQGGAPVSVVDEQTQRVYYLISADQFDRVRALLAGEEFHPREMYPLIAKTAAEAGWDDPLMDEYNDYDEYRSKS